MQERATGSNDQNPARRVDMGSLRHCGTRLNQSQGTASWVGPILAGTCLGEFLNPGLALALRRPAMLAAC